MRRDLSRTCNACGGKMVVMIKTHYLGSHFVEKCDCGTKLSLDPFEIKWNRYSKEERDNLK